MLRQRLGSVPLALKTNARTAWNFPVWKTIKLGLHKTPDEYRKALKKAGSLIVGQADEMLNKTPYAQRETSINLVNIFPCALRLINGGTFKELCIRAVEMGFELCPAEAGPALRLAYNDQPEDEWLRVASEPITTSRDGRAIFIVGCGSDGLWLEGDDDGYPDTFWHGGYRFVFKTPRR
jgi:hypothetical protein